MTNPVKLIITVYCKEKLFKNTFHKVIRALEHMHSLMRVHAWVLKLGLVPSRRVTNVIDFQAKGV